MGSGGGVPAGDKAAIEEAMENLPDNYTVQQVRRQLDRCDEAWTLTEVTSSNDPPIFQREITSGDINRSVVRSAQDRRLRDYYWDIYYKEVEQLARILWVPEYRTPNNDHWRFARSGGEFVMSLPGVADSCVSDRIYLSINYA
jgi:hypothetical protein